jgi:hypothetical protein
MPTTDGPTEQTTTSIFDEPETESAETTGATGPEAETETEGSTVEVEAAPETTEETADDWLPTDQEKVFPADVLAKFATRYGYSAEELQGDPRIARIVQEKLNSDIYIRQLKEQAETEPEVVEEAEEEARPTVAQPQQPPTEQEVQAYLKRLEEYATPKVNSQVAKHFGTQLGTTLQQMFVVGKDGKVSIDPEKAGNFGQAAFVAMVNVIDTLTTDPEFASRLVKSGMDASYSGFSDHWQQGAQQRAWEQARGSDPAFKSAPAAGTPEWEAKMGELAQQFPHMATAVYSDPKTGRPYPADKQYRIKSEFALKFLTGQPLTKTESARVEKAIETGKKLERQATVQKRSGNLGAGQPKGEFKKALTNNDDIFGAPGEVAMTSKLVGKS